MRWLPLLATTATALLAGAWGCSVGLCTEVGCESHLAIELPENLPEGYWRFEIVTEGMHWTCETNLPIDESPSCTGRDVELIRGRSAPGELRLAWTPEEVEIRVFRDRDEVHASRIVPRYRKVQPNGPDCEPTCRIARERLELEP